MRDAAGAVWHGFGAIVATLIGIAFFFGITGVFGVPASIVALGLFVILAILIFYRPQLEEMQR